MESYIPLLATAFVVSCLVSGYYWLVVRPILLRRTIYGLFEKRDNLRNLAIDKKIPIDSIEFQETERGICKTISLAPKLTLGSFLWYSLKTIDEQENYIEASPMIEKIRNKAARDVMKVMLLNSPLLALVVMTTAFILWIGGKFNGASVLRRAEIVVEKMPWSGIRWAI